MSMQGWAVFRRMIHDMPSCMHCVGEMLFQPTASSWCARFSTDPQLQCNGATHPRRLADDLHDSLISRLLCFTRHRVVLVLLIYIAYAQGGQAAATSLPTRHLKESSVLSPLECSRPEATVLLKDVVFKHSRSSLA